MQDHIPDALIAAFERQYDASWNDPQLRNERLAMRYGWTAAIDQKQKQCLFQIQEPVANQQLTAVPMTAMTNPLREAEAALEVALARILKADAGHSISVTSEAKALVAVRQALSAQAAPVAVGEREAFAAITAGAPRLSGAEMIEALEWRRQAEFEARKAPVVDQISVDSINKESSPQSVIDKLAPAPAAAPVPVGYIHSQSVARLERGEPVAVLKYGWGGETGHMAVYAHPAEVAAPAPVVLPEPDAALLNQGIELLHALSCDERNRGNCSASEGAAASAYAVQRLAAALLAGVPAPAAQAVDIADLVTGMSVSVDVSTVDDDAGNRYFGTVTVAQEDPHDKHGLTLLVQDAKPNFTPQAQADARDAERLDYLETRGATVEVGATSDNGKMFRIGGLRSSESKSLRAAIDNAQAAQQGGAA